MPPESKQKIAEYYLSRFKSVISNTNKIAILFLFTLFYVWYKSVNPTVGFLKNIITSKEQSIYFDSVYSPLNRRYTAEVRAINEKKIKDLQQRLDSVTGAGSLSYYEYFNKDTLLISDAVFNKRLIKRKNKYNTAILPIKHYRDSITNILQDSLKNYQLKIDIPTLNTIEVDLNIGIPIWMCLASFFIVLMFLGRNTSFRYLHKCLRIYYDNQADPAQLDDLDASIPFWMHPIKIETKRLNGRDMRHLIQDHQPVLKTILVISLLGFLLFLQFRTATLIWNKHEFWNYYHHTLFEPAYFSRAISFLMLSVSSVMAVLWIIPKRLNMLNAETNNILEPSRRKFLVIGGAIFFIQFLKPVLLFSDIKAKPFNYRRKKPVRENKNVLSPSFSGFYINSRKKYRTIHYFDEVGRNIMFRTITKENLSKFLSNLKKVNIFDYFQEIKKGFVGFPGSVWALEMAAEQSIKAGNFREALLLLQNGIEINFYNESRMRLTSKFKKQLRRVGTGLSKNEVRMFEAFLSSTKRKAKKVKNYISDTQPAIK